MAYTQDTYLLQATFTDAQIDALTEEGYKAYDRFAEAYLNYKTELTKPAKFTVYGGSYTMKNSDVPVEIDAATTNMTISSVLYADPTAEPPADPSYATTSFALTATDFINNGTIRILDESEDDYSVTFTSNATFTNNNSVTVSNAIFDVENVENVENSETGATGTFNLTDGAEFEAGTVTNSGTFNLTGDAEFFATTVTNSGTFSLNDATFTATNVTNNGTFTFDGQNTVKGAFTGGTLTFKGGAANTQTTRNAINNSAITGTSNIEFAAGTEAGNAGGFFHINASDITGNEITVNANNVFVLAQTGNNVSTIKANKLTVADTGKIIFNSGNNVLTGTGTDSAMELDGTLNFRTVTLQNSKIADANGEKGLLNVLSSKVLTLVGESTIAADINVEASATLKVAEDAEIDGEADIINAGKLLVYGDATVGDISNSVTVDEQTTAGTLTVYGSLTAGDITNVAKLTTVYGSLTAESISSTAAVLVSGTDTVAAALAADTVAAKSLNIQDKVTLTGNNNTAMNLTTGNIVVQGQGDGGEAELINSNVNGKVVVTTGKELSFSGENTVGAIVNTGTITVGGKLTAGAVTNNSGSSLTLAENATLTASSLTVTESGTLSTVTNATVSVTNGITAAGKDLTFLLSSVSAKTITANSVVFRNATTLNIGTITDGTAVTIQSKNPTGGTRAMVTGSSVGKGSVTTANLAGFSGTNYFDVINNIGNLTVAGSLTANSITNSENATFTVSAAGTKLNTKFTGTIDFADGATLGDSSFGAGSVITANGSDFLATSATKLNLVASKENVVLTIAPDNGQLTKGAITINGEFGENDPQMIQVISGKVVESEDLTITCNVNGYNKFVSDNGVYLVKGLQPATSIAVNTAWVNTSVDTLVTDGAGNSYIIGYNAFSTFTGALSAASKLTEASEITLLSDVTENDLVTMSYKLQNAVTVKGNHTVVWNVTTQTGDDGSVYFFGDKDKNSEKLTFVDGTTYQAQGVGPIYIGYDPKNDNGPENRMDAEFAGTIQTSSVYVGRWSSLTVTGTIINGGWIYLRKHSKILIDGSDRNSEAAQVSTSSARIYGGTTTVLDSVVSIGGELKVSNRNVTGESDYNMPAETTVFGATNSTISANSFDGNIVGTETNGDAKDGVTSLVKSTMTIKNDVNNFGTFYVGVAVKAKDIVEEGKVVKNTVEVDDTVTDTASTLTLTEGSLNNYGTVKAKSSTIDVATGDVVNQGATKYVVTYDFAKNTNYQVKFFSGDEVKLTKDIYSTKNLSSYAWMITEGDLDAGTYTVKVFKGEDELQVIADQKISYNEAAISLDASTLTADTISNNGAITVTNSTLSATVVTSAEGATFTVGGTSTLNISGTSSSLTGTILLADKANVKATIAKGGTLDVAANTAATLAAGTSVASVITNAGTLTLNSVTKTGRITNDGTVSGSASTVGGITNNDGSVTLTGKSFSSVSVKDGAVTLTAEDAVSKAIAVGSITNGTKGTKDAEAIDGTFTANGNVTGSGAITNYAGSINVTGSLTLTQNKTTKVLPAITNGSIYTYNSGNTHIVRVGVGSIEVTGDLTAGNIVNGIENGATEPVDKSFITAANITADSITNYGTIGSQAQGKPHITTLTLEQREVTVGGEPATTTGALINKKYGEVFAGTLNAASIENEGGIDVGAIEITSEDGTFENKVGAKVLAGTSIEANAITNEGYIQAGNAGTIEAAALTNGAYVADTEDGYIHAKDITAASIENNGKIVAEGAVTTTAGDITNGTAATTEPEVAAAVEGTIDAGSIAATGDIVNNAGSVTVSGKISGASISNAGSIEAGSIETTGEYGLGNSGTIGTSTSATAIETTILSNSGTIYASTLNATSINNSSETASITAVSIEGTGTASLIENAGSISAVNVTAATVSTNGASFTVGGTAAELNISKKLTGTITLADGANVTAMVKGGTLGITASTASVSLVGEAGNTAAVTNLGELTIAGGVIGAVTNSGTLTVEAADGAAAIQTGAFANYADVDVESAFTVKGTFTNNGTITIDASKFVLGEDNTVQVISVTGTLTNNGDIKVTGIPEDETRQVFVKNDGDDKGVYLFGGKADMTELLVYSDLEYKPGQSFSFAGHGYVYAVNAFTSANAITQIADDTEFIHFVPQEEAYGNLNLNLSATQDLTVDMINATGRQVVGTFNFNNLIIASEVTEPNDDDEGITAGSIEFVNDVATGENATVSIAAATAVFEGANFSESKSVTIQEEADVTFGGAFSAKATTIKDSEVDFATATISGKATVTNSIVGFSGAASFADAATFTDSTVGFAGATFTAANTTGKATVTFSGSDVGFAGDANFTNEDEAGFVNVAITNSTVTFDGKATVEGALTLSGSEVDFGGEGESTVGGLLKLTGSTVTVKGSTVEAGSTSLDKNSALKIAKGSATLGTTSGNGKIYMDVSSTLAFSSDSTFTGTIDVDVTGLTATTTEAPATITGITEALRNNNLTISGKNASNNWAKYFAFDAEGKTLTLLAKATNVITATGNTNINKALAYRWTGSDEKTYYADNVVIQGGATSTLYLQGNGSYVTLDDDAEYTVGIYGGKYTEATTSRTGVNLGGDINIAIEGGSFTKVVVGGDRINVASGRAVYYREDAEGNLADINLTINGGTFDNYVATGVLYQGENLQGSVEVGSTNLKINGGTFAKDVYGGNYGNKKSSSSCTFVESSNVTLTVGGAEKINMAACLFVGSFGSGKVETTKLTLAGQSTDSDALVVKEIWGGCGSDYNKDVEGGTTTYETAVSGSRTLSFTGFQAAINSRLVSGFSDVEVLSNGLLDKDRFDTNATLQDTVKLSDVENWTFEAGSTLNGAFINDFAGDTLTLKGIGDYFEATGLDSWTLFGDTTNFTGFDSFAKDKSGDYLVKFDGVGARFEEGAWVAGDYKLSIDDESKAMVLSRQQLA